MGDDGLPPDALFPRVGGSYVAPYLWPCETGIYKPLRNERAVIITALTPQTCGTIYLYPGSQPGSDTIAIPVTSGRALLDARGTWYIKHSGVGTETFRVTDAGAIGNAQALLDLFGGGNPAAPATVSVGTSSTVILAADGTRARYVLSNCDGTNPVFLAFGGNAAVAASGVRIAPGGAFVCEPSDSFASLEVRGIATGAAVDVAIQTWS